MVEPQIQGEPASSRDGDAPDRPADSTEITAIMDEFSARLDVIRKKYPPRQNAPLPGVGEAGDPTGAVNVMDLDRLAEEDSRIISQSRLRVEKASASMTELQKELDKMEAYKKLLSMVRRGFSDAKDRNYWNSRT